MPNPPLTVELTDAERALAEQINFMPNHLTLHGDFDDVLEKSCAAAKPLARSLLKRKAIPKVRIDYFVDPEYNVGSKRSRKQIFEGNGTRGDDILEHGNFLKYLHYFIYGPDLPTTVIKGFCDQVDRDDDPEVLRRYARRMVRDHSLDRRRGAEEFYKLALECDLDESVARSVRDAALQTR